MAPAAMPSYVGRSILMEAKMIFPVESQSDVRSKPALPLTTTLGPVRIAVTDRDKALAIWSISWITRKE